MLSPRILRIMRQAAMAARATRGRQGNVIVLDDAVDVVVAGDLHGNLANLKKILHFAALETNPQRHLVLQELVHGSDRYPDGGDTSHRLLEAVAVLKLEWPHRLHILPGNHEMAEWTGRAIAKDGEALNVLFARGVQRAHGPHAEEILEAYDEFFSALPVAVRTPSRIFISHSLPTLMYQQQFEPELFDNCGITEEQLHRGSSFYALLWGRDVDQKTADSWAKTVDADWLVTGHIACDNGYTVPNNRQVILDCTGYPAACLLAPAQGTLSHKQLLDGLYLLPDC